MRDTCLLGNVDWWKHGLSYTKQNFLLLGSMYKRAANRQRLSRYAEEPMMNHPIYRVRSFAIVAPYTLHVTFDDATEQTINFEPVLGGELYRPLRDLSLFEQVQLDPDVQTLVWPNGADFDPATLHDWPNYVDALAARAQHWDLQPA